MRLKYKQMAFDTSVRNPERFIEILSVIVKFEGVILNDENLLTIVSTLYKENIVTSKRIDTNKNIDEIKKLVIEVNETRKADGGFPGGYQSRFWTYMRTLSELGFVYARYNKELKLSNIAKKLVDRIIDEEEAFSIQTIKHNRKSPYRKVLNDFNFFKFILKILLKKERLSYEQFVVAMFSKDGDVNNFLKLINNYKFNDENETYEFLKDRYGVSTNFQTTMHDYPDVVRRMFIISGFVTIRYKGKKFIEVNKNRLDYIKELCSVNFNLTQKEKEDEWEFFKKMSIENPFIEIAQKYRKSLNAINYTNQLYNIINEYKITEDIIIKSILGIGKKKKEIIEEFKEIPEPLKLEFYISILIAIRYKDMIIKPNYKADHLGKPYSHAPGNMGDIEVYKGELYWLIEVTLIRNKNQQLNNETTSVIRHLLNTQYKLLYLSLVAPIIHQDTREFFDISIIKLQSQNRKLFIKPYSIEDFISENDNLADMEKYSKEVFDKFRKILCKDI
jgi:hypothetical protein